MRAREPLGAVHHGGALELSASGPRVPGRLASPAGWVGLAGLLIAGLLISLSAAHTEVLLPRSLRQSLGGLAGAFGHVGLDIGLPGLIAAMVLMSSTQGHTEASAPGQAPQVARAVLGEHVALNALVLVAPPLLSTDLFSYIAYGRLGGTYGINPYLYGPNVISFDPLYHLVGTQWTHTPTAYGPLFTALSYPLAGLNIATNVFAYKGIAALSCLAIVVLVWHAAQLRGMDPVKAVALVGLNPVIVIYGVGGGHNDLLMLALLVAGIYVLLRQREGTGGAMIMAATAIKLTAGMLLPFAIAASAGRRVYTSGRPHGPAPRWPPPCAWGDGLLMFGSGTLHLVGTLQTIQSHGGVHSIPGFILHALGLKQHDVAVGGCCTSATPSASSGLAWRVWIGEGLDHRRGLGHRAVSLPRRPAHAVVHRLADPTGRAELRPAAVDHRHRPTCPGLIGPL